jgi:iron complex outermembrane receptor protein
LFISWSSRVRRYQPGLWIVLSTGLMLFAFLYPWAAAAEPEEKKEKKEDVEESLADEFDELKEDDYPDLVSADETGELMDEFTLLAEEDVVFTAARHKQEIGMSPSAVTVVTREDIETSGATTFTDLLRLVPGMDVLSISPYFTAITARLYWTNENNHFLVLVDGREANLDSIGQTPWVLQPILLEDIERIEIIRGPGSSLYGANAVAGVVSITTRSLPEKTSGWARVIGGEAGIVQAGARASTRIGDWGFSLSGGGDYAGAFDDARITSKSGWMLRSVIEYHWSEDRRLLLEAAASESTGPIQTAIGNVDSTLQIRTLRLNYKSEDLRSQLVWSWTPNELNMTFPLDYKGVRLARFAPVSPDSHTIDMEIQWTLPRFAESLLVIVGGGARSSWLKSDQFLDADTYPDNTSSSYHQPGVSYWEARAGVFVHAEYTPTDWVTVTGGLRLDYNTETGSFLSPRLATVFRPARGQFVRAGVARAFRKPAFLESGAHFMAEFPDDSPITGDGQELFQEFLTRVIGNSKLGHEELLAFEVGYLGQFLDSMLSVSWDLYYNLHTNVILMDSQIVMDEMTGLPDLEKSSFMFNHISPDLAIIGSELSVRYNFSEHVSLLASWVHREVIDLETGDVADTSPKNLITLGGRFKTHSGLLGSLYAFSRSEFLDYAVENPAGLLEPTLEQHMDNVLLVLGKLGWQWEYTQGVKIEAGVKLLLPVSPFSGPLFKHSEKGGGITATGMKYGGQELCRMVTGYLQGSF